MKLLTPSWLALGSLLWATAIAEETTTVYVPTGTCAPSQSPAPLSATVIVYTTTDSHGSTIVTSSTSFISGTGAPAPTGGPSSTTILITTTNSLGSTTVITSVSVQSATVTGGASATSANPASPSYPCPAAFAAPYKSNEGVSWDLSCETQFYYDDLPSVNTNTFAQCISACDNYVPAPQGNSFDQACVAVTWVQNNPNGNNCYLKSAVAQVVYGTPDYCSAKKSSYSLPPNLSVTVYRGSSSTTTGTGAAIGGTPTTSTPASSTSYSYIEPASPCPFPNNTYYQYPDGKGINYLIQCGIAYNYNDLPSANVDTFAHCIAACDAWVPNPPGNSYDQPCVGVTYVGFNSNGNNCYLKSALGTSTSFGSSPMRLVRRLGGQYADSAIRKDGVPSNSVSTGMVSSTSAAGSSSSGSSTSSSSGTRSSTSTGSTSASSGSGSAAATSTGTITSPAGSAATSDLSSPIFPCPAGNDTMYTQGGTTYMISCDTSFDYSDLPSTDSVSFTDCMQDCNDYEPVTSGSYANQACVAITFNPNNPNGNGCYLHSPGYSVRSASGLASAQVTNGTSNSNSTSGSGSSSSSSMSMSTSSRSSSSVRSSTSSSSSTASSSGSSTRSSTSSSSTSSSSGSSTTSSRSSSSSASSTTSYTNSTSSASSSTMTFSNSSTSTSATAAASTSATTSGLVGAPASTNTCEADGQSFFDGSLYADGNGHTYSVNCNATVEYTNEPESPTVSSLYECMAACDNYVPAPQGDSGDQPCVAAALFDNTCYLQQSGYTYTPQDGTIAILKVS